MGFFLFFLSFLWFIRETKAILFWLYLWQLKEYHIGRFLDHFSTAKGKQLIFNKLLIFKIFLILTFLYFFLFSFKILPYFFKFFGIPFLVLILLVLILYIFEAVHALFGLFQGRLKKPVLTEKTAILILTALILEILFIFTLSIYLRDEFGVTNFVLVSFCLLLFDILTPLIASAIVLLFQPLAVLGRNQIIKKAKKKRAEFKNLLVIGITGSYGKTSTKEFLATILSEKFNVLKTEAHQNSEVGISQCILNDLKPEHEIFVCEMGAYNRGGIKLLCDIAKPKIGILTGINEQHMATFGSQDNIIHTKFELIQALPEDGLAILNGSDPKIKNYNSKLKNIKFYSVDDEEDIWAEDIKVEKEFIFFKTVAKDGDYVDFRLNLFGGHNVLNILGAAAAAKELGMNLKEISATCEKIKPEQSGFQLKKGVGGLNIIDATYSANPDGVISHLEYLKLWSGRKVIVMPCLIELGSSSKDVHKRIGRKIGEVCDLAIITTKDRFKEIKEGVIEKGMKRENILFIEEPKEIFEKIKSFSRSDDIVLLESRVPNQLTNQLLNETI